MGGTLAHTPRGAAPGGVLLAPEHAPPLPLAVYEAAEKLHSHVRELARVTFASITAIPDSFEARLLETRARTLTETLNWRAESLNSLFHALAMPREGQ